jgi:hypothetical protein
MIVSVYGQKVDSLYYFSGQVLSKQGNYPVALAHIINTTQGWGVVADTLGHFNIWVKPDDSLNVSAIGFDYNEYNVRGFLNDSLVKIKLESRYYEIPEVAISYLGTYKQFEQKVLNLELPDLGINPEFEKLFKHVEPPPLFVEPRVTSPASLIYVLFSKDAKDKKKYAELVKEDKVKSRVRERYNEHIIRNLTGLSGKKASQFMDFCDFKDEYILSIDDYNLYSEILLRFEAYKKEEEDSLKSE